MKDFEGILQNQGTSDRDSLLGEVVTTAMSIRGHRAAYKTSQGVGVLTPYRYRYGYGVSTLGIAVALVTDRGKIFVEGHNAAGVDEDNLDNSECGSYSLTAESGFTTIGDFTTAPSDRSHAYRCSRSIKTALGEGCINGAADLTSDGRDIVLDLWQLGHRITNPVLNNFVSLALRDEMV
ncbi:MAG TPA: hypothetical protein VMY99_04350 [Nevskiaceae bacterium]|nr:hypothetical protein [Nevskiaceae bacterium]